MAQQKLIVSRADCDQVIKKCIANEIFEVVNFKVKPFEDKDTEYYKPDCLLEVSAKISKNISRFRFFLKQFTTHSPALDKLLLHSVRASEREILFYEHFVPMLQGALQNYQADFAADYLFGDVNRLMILEDVSLKFFTMAKKSHLHVLDRFHVSLALRAAAKLHAASWAYEEKLNKDEAGEDSVRLFDERDLLSQEPIWRHDCLGEESVQAGVKGLKTLLKEAMMMQQNNLINENIDDLVEKTFNIMRFQTKFRNVLTHGNLHPKNMLFKYDKHTNHPTECVLLNFGFCRYFLPAHDFLTAVFSSTNRLFRQHYFTYLVDYYYECLHNELMKQELHINQFLTLEEFRQSINYLMPAVKLQAVLHLQDFGAKAGFYKMLQKEDKLLYQSYLFEDKSFFVLELYKKDPVFKQLIVEALEELVEVLQTPQVSRENCYEILEGQLETTVYDLKKFNATPVGEDGKLLELLLEVLNEGYSKEEASAVNKYKCLVRCGATGNFFKLETPLIECFGTGNKDENIHCNNISFK